MMCTKNYSTPFQSLFFIVILIAFSFTMHGCDTTGAVDDDRPAFNEVWIENQAFYPGNRTVQTGTTVRWINRSNEVHTVTSGASGEHDGQFDSEEIQPGGTFNFTFTEEGTYYYFCIPHQPHMTGVITVTDEETDPNGGY